MSCAIVAWGASSGLGEGENAFASGDRAITRVVRDDELAAAGLGRPFCARVPGTADVGARDRATVLFERALTACARELDGVLPGWRGRRVGLAIGTSSGGMRTFENAKDLEATPLPIEATYLGPVLAAERPCAFEPFTLVLGACASSTIAAGIARAWLLDDACDVALAGGFDALGVFVASGFEVLRATSSVAGPRPFRIGRDGLALGEGAAVLALARPHDVVPKAVHAYVTGFGASCDATHLTAPDRTGAGLAKAMRDALGVAGIEPAMCGLVSAHGTATTFNDDAESKAIAAVYGEGGRPVVHAFKGTIGHTLGAAGALETLAAIDAMTRGTLPPSYGGGESIAGIRVLDAAQSGNASAAIKLSSAFGGANAALVVEKAVSSATRDTKPKRQAWISRAVSIADGAVPTAADLARRTGYAEDRIARADELVRLTLAAVAQLEDRVGSLAGAGIVVGHGLATIETNVAYLMRIRSAGAARAEPRRFPFTTPNASSGEAAIAFELTGPSFAVGGGAHGGIEALRVAVDLVRDGVSDRIVVVAADDAGQYSRIAAPGMTTGAVALLVTSERAEGRVDEVRVRLEQDRMPDAVVAGAPMHSHAALLPFSADPPAETVEAPLPWGGFAKATVYWV